jgi:hypothetical protein
MLNMPFPSKFKALLEAKPGDVASPSEIWISFAVCGTSQDSCGWSGWILESVVDAEGRQLPAATDQVCGRCGKQLFRTVVAIKAVQAPDQSSTLVPGRDYVASPTDYE